MRGETNQNPVPARMPQQPNRADDGDERAEHNQILDRRLPNRVI